MLGKVELKLNMPTDMSSKGYNRNKSIPKIATKNLSLSKQLLLPGHYFGGCCGPATKVMHSTHSCYIHWGHLKFRYAIPVLNRNCMPWRSHRKAATGFLEVEQKMSASYTHFLSNLEACEVQFTNE